MICAAASTQTLARQEAMARPRDIEVTLTLLPTEHGGRNGPAFSGYRPQFYYSGQDFDGVHEYPDVGSVNPGDTVKAFIVFLSPAYHLGKLKPGTAFLIREGQRVVGYGAVTQILDLEASAKRALAGDGFARLGDAS